MAKGNIGANTYKAFWGSVKIKKGYIGTTRVYSAGNNVTYVVDTGISYQEEVDDGESCLLPATFTPAKSGWEFVGWRQDTSASSSVLDSLVMGDEPVTLYAVFSQTITLSYNANGGSGSTAAQTGSRYYNNSNIANPSFTLRGNGFSRSGYNFSKWAMGSAGGTQYSVGASVSLSANTTFYAVWTAATKYIIQNGNGSMVELDRDSHMSYNFGYSASNRVCGWYNVDRHDWSDDESMTWATCRSQILDLRGIRKIVFTIYSTLETTVGVVFEPSSVEHFGSGSPKFYCSGGENNFTINAPFPSDYCYVGIFLDNGIHFSGVCGIRELRLEP